MTPPELFDWLCAHGHTPERRGEQVFVLRWPDVPEDKRALVLQHRDALRTLVPMPTTAPEQAEEEHTAAAAGEPTPPEPPAVVAPEPEPPPITAVPRPYELPYERREAAGLYWMNGVWTHSRGDQFAQAVLDGRIRYEEAVAQREATVAMLATINGRHRR